MVLIISTSSGCYGIFLDIFGWSKMILTFSTFCNVTNIKINWPDIPCVLGSNSFGRNTCSRSNVFLLFQPLDIQGVHPIFEPKVHNSREDSQIVVKYTKLYFFATSNCPNKRVQLLAMTLTVWYFEIEDYLWCSLFLSMARLCNLRLHLRGRKISSWSIIEFKSLEW